MAPLAAVRRRKLLSQRALAERSGVSESTIFAIERGTSQRPRLEVMRKLCETLGVEPTEIDEFRRAVEDATARLAA